MFRLFERNRVRKRGSRRIQVVALRSDVLEVRGIRHLFRVQQSNFVRDFKTTQVKTDRTRDWSQRQRLAEVQAGIMGKKTWHTDSEAWLQRSAAAWGGLQVGSQLPCKSAGGLEDAFVLKVGAAAASLVEAR